MTGYSINLFYIGPKAYMLAHAFAWSKMIENHKKTFFIMRTRDSWKAHVEIWTKMSIHICVWVFCARNEKSIFYDDFQVFFKIIFDHRNACASLPFLVEIYSKWLKKPILVSLHTMVEFVFDLRSSVIYCWS